MIAKVPPRRTDGKSSFAKLVEYATKREDDKKVLTDELDPSYNRRDYAILETARAHLERAADHLRASGRISSLDADAIRKRLGGARRALDPDGRRYVEDTHGFPNDTDQLSSGNTEGVDIDEHERSLTSARKYLATAARHLRQATRVNPNFETRARARRAAVTFHASAAQRGVAADERDAVADLELGSLLGDSVNVKSKSGVSCQHNCLSLETAASEMRSVADQNVRVKDPVYHVILSWPPDESPTDGQAFASGLHAMEAVGMRDHQYVFAIHHDTDCVHLHMTVNRVHPESFNSVYPDRDYFKLDYAMRELEMRFGWRHVNGPSKVVEVEGVRSVVWSTSKPKMQGKIPTKAADMERHADQESLFTYARGAPRKEIIKLLAVKDLSWQMLHTNLAKYGLGIRPKGRGLSVFDFNDVSATGIKASDMHEQLSLARLVKRLGGFEDRALPNKILGVHKYDKYAAPKRDPLERQKRRDERAQLRKATRAGFDAYRAAFVYRRVDKEWIKQQFKVIRDQARLQRADIKSRISHPSDRKAFYSILAFETLRSREELKTKIQVLRRELKEDPTNHKLSFREWVEREAAIGDPGAISQLRGFSYGDRRKRNTEGNAILFAGDIDPKFNSNGFSVGTVRRDGAVVFRRTDGDPGYVDHGEKISFPGGLLDDELLAHALDETRSRWERPLDLKGTPEFIDAALNALIERGYTGTLADPSHMARLKSLTEQQASTKLRPVKRGPRG
ncbi:TraI/MobA(P) family conjugative relaxase [Pseudomonas sp. CCI3.1]|jgi:Relaxase/Mobilisation nuclease domain.|uniref:TraI/MobA(P) family conjugative relaxase n=1 Tax=Pseudomonas sp. CCI3.1 TaxID=3048618 RepID=UPI002AB37AE9|nr:MULTISPECIES: TraI/MobA(P) family conjugative relaxase [unclassified Pseudomonas]MDY7585073.1 TraI/MobA(P) family conjugative relaxase [Pseudomonas sp. CCI3.1]MEB0066013.1 relaxase/mobilization nuclease domain-containing protein [Pseudomonas sp. CCI3.1]MEB0072963.1 relaxase/mobilization nuclease domain-containing protein [Pseudomonas sp. CCI1.4]